jgi:NAD(P)-dependent dehydrogenase (short-subunit alcohol dehydrogenase family)
MRRYRAQRVADNLDRLELQGRGRQSRSKPQRRTRGPRDSREHARVPGEEQGDAVKDILRANNPSKRMADPLEIAKLAVYLASDESAYVVGADFLIDGGVTAISAVGA